MSYENSTRARAALLAIAMLVAVPLQAAPAEVAAVQTQWILDKISRPAPMSTGFIELRGSALLKDPLRISGQYHLPREGVLVREVRAPYAETTTISHGEAAVARHSKRTRTFSLSRVPELAGMQASFGALLAGDRELVEQHYRIESAGTRERWRLLLTPRHEDLAAKVKTITLHGQGGELRCIETQPAARGDVQRTLLAGAALAAKDEDDAAVLMALCQA